MSYISRTNVPLGNSSTQTTPAWESGIVTPLNSVISNSQTRDLVKNRIYGLQIDWTSSSSVTINTGVCFSDNKVSRMKLSSSVVVSFSNPNGVNGLDTGSRTNTTWYYVWLIMNTSGTIGGLFSTSSTSPTLPSGYIYKRLVGAVRNHFSLIIPFITTGSTNTKYYYYDYYLTVLSGATNSIFSDKDMNAYLPIPITQLNFVSAFIYSNGGTPTATTLTGYIKSPNATTAAIKPKTAVTSSASSRFYGDTLQQGWVSCDKNGNLSYRVDSASNTPTMKVYMYGYVLEL